MDELGGTMRIRHAIWIALFSASAGSLTTYSLMLQETDALPLTAIEHLQYRSKVSEHMKSDGHLAYIEGDSIDENPFWDSSLGFYWKQGWEIAASADSQFAKTHATTSQTNDVDLTKTDRSVVDLTD